jgi:hypothetical protein
VSIREHTTAYLSSRSIYDTPVALCESVSWLLMTRASVTNVNLTKALRADGD